MHEHLEHHGIPAAILYPAALHQQPAWRSRRSHPVAERASAEVLSLPMHPYLKQDALEQVSEVIQRFTLDVARRA